MNRMLCISWLCAALALALAAGCGGGAKDITGDGVSATDSADVERTDSAQPPDTLQENDLAAPDSQSGDLQSDGTLLDTTTQDASPDGVAADLSPDLQSDDATSDASQPDGVASCPPQTACNKAPTAEGACPGSCVAQVQKQSCRGTVVAGLCYGRVPPLAESVAQTADGLTITPVSVPDKIYQVGDKVDLVLTLKNVSGAPLVRDLEFKLPVDWTVLSANFLNWTGISLAVDEELQLTATLEAKTPNALNTSFGIMNLSFSGGAAKGLVYDIVGVIGFAEQPNYIACGGSWWPNTWCPGGACGQSGYNTGVCCDGVFYPGSECCSTADCGVDNGVCADGYCVRQVPQFGSANTLPVGHQRVLVVMSDFTSIQPGQSICANRYQELKSTLFLDDVEGWIDGVLSERTGRPEKLLHFQWTVLAGLTESDFIKDGKYDATPFRNSLETYLQAKGCLTDFFDFDKVIMLSDKIVLCCGYGGQAFGDGRVMMRYINKYLMIHELMHTWGARDTYVNIGNWFQYQGDLMGNYLGHDPVPDDGVMWAEIGLGDHNLDGVIDLFEYAHYPSALVIAELTATLNSNKSSVELHVSVGAEENGLVQRVRLKRLTISLPDFALNSVVTSAEPDTVVFSLTTEQLNALTTDGEVAIKLSAEHLFTDETFTRTTLNLDKTVTVKLKGIN